MNRDKQAEIEKIPAQQQLVEQMEANKILQHSLTRNFEEQVREKTKQLTEQHSVLEQERDSSVYIYLFFTGS